MRKRSSTAAGVGLLGLMAALMFASTWDDTPTSDDNVAIISGYSYLLKQEYRLEPQNPPLMEDLAAVPLLFMDLREPWDSKSWVEANDPELGQEFLYRSGNDPDAILRAARMPMILFAVAFGGILFWWTRKEFGGGTALLATFLYTFSPTVLAHGRIAATDLGATAGFFITTIALFRFLKNSTWGNVALAGLAMGFAFLTKFSTVALVPMAVILASVWALIHGEKGTRIRVLWHYLGRTACTIAIACLVIYLVYLHHTWNYTPERQRADAVFQQQLYGMEGAAITAVVWASDKPMLRPGAEYFLGLLAALKVSDWGQPLFFLGAVHPTGLRWYFPFVYLIKEPLALHALTLTAFLLALTQIWKNPRRGQGLLWLPRNHGSLREWLAEHFTEFAFLVMLAIYWAALIRSNMNIGVRHLLPAFPLTFILVGSQIAELYRRAAARPAAWGLRPVVVFRMILGALLAWQVASTLRVHPSYLAYFNELAGGPDGGWRYVNDSNLDWGQDVKRLAQFAEERGIAGMHADLFGPADPAYYLKERFQGSIGCSQPPRGWVAVSAMLYTGAPWNRECDYRRWLPMEKLAAKVGYSIFVFHVE